MKNPIKEWRKRNYWTQPMLAEDLNELGASRGKISRQQIRTWEKGIHIPTDDILEALAEVMQVKPDKLREELISYKKQKEKK